MTGLFRDLCVNLKTKLNTKDKTVVKKAGGRWGDEGEAVTEGGTKDIIPLCSGLPLKASILIRESKHIIAYNITDSSNITRAEIFGMISIISEHH